MGFLSYKFLIFLAVFVVFYYTIPKQLQWVLLLFASLIFYVSYGFRYAGYILITGTTVYGLALSMERVCENGEKKIQGGRLNGKAEKECFAELKKTQKRLLWLGLCLNLGILLVVKYTNFAIWNWNHLLSALGKGKTFESVDWLLPLGISYYTLQALGYLLDVYHGKIKAERNPFRILLFLSFFPQVIQGPVSRFDTLRETLFCRHSWSWERICLGLQRILWGFFKKLVVADRVAPVVLAVGQNSRELDGIYVLIGMAAYTLQLYGDFTGGIDIAAGCAQLFGVELPENFRIPFSSESLAEYWRRWHITLIQWFREYVFYPIAGHGIPKGIIRVVKKLGGKKAAIRLPVYIASGMTWFLTGIWHGASWNFVIWGMTNCVILLISQELAPWYRRFHSRWKFSNTEGYRRFMSLRTLLLVSMVQMFEYYPTPGDAVRMFSGMFGSLRPEGLFDGRAALLGITMADTVILSLAVLLFYAVGSLQKWGSAREWVKKRPEWFRFSIWFGLFLSVLIFGVYGQGYDAGQFIYNQF